MTSQSRSRQRRATRSRRTAARRETYQLKITLKDIRPPIWRRVQVPGNIMLASLHDVIQTAMGWSDAHLHEYEVDGQRYGIPDPDWDDGQVRPEHKVRLADVADAGSRLLYTYDFGDDWRHLIEVEKVDAPEPDVELPRCLAGRRGCPPEDVGGPWGYAEFLEVYRDTARAEHESMLEWAGPYFDPEAFAADDVTRALRGDRSRLNADAGP
jgi:Plasmid pRiA4b ORF-3-like protein